MQFLLVLFIEVAFSFSECYSGHLNIPEYFTEIPMSYYEKCNLFNGSLDIPPNITKIGSSAFMGCT